MRITSVSLPAALTDQLDQVARQSERSRSYVVRKLLEQSLTGVDRLAALQAIADDGLEEYTENSRPKRGPNATEIIAEASTAGHEAVRAHQKIASR